jgi:hypothetical protein
MCFASLHVPNRKATKTEMLSVQPIPNFGGWKGLYSANKKHDQSKLVCVVGKTKAVVLKVAFEAGMAPATMAWQGKRRVEVTLLNHNHGMWMQFEDGSTVALNNLKAGTRVNINVPVRQRKPKAASAAGLVAIDGAIDEATKTPAPAPEKVEA